MRLDGHVAVVTGGTGPLGRAVAGAFLDAGATVIATSRHAADGGRPGLRVVGVDLADEQSVLGLGREVGERDGRCDHLVCCAGGWAGGPPLAETSLAAWQGQLERNATTAFLAARAFLPGMLAAGRGSIVFVGSRTALQPAAGQVPYGVSKAAVVALTTALAAEVRDRGVTVDCVLPSVIDTPANREAFPKADHERWVAPAELAATILWLSSDASRTTSGAIVPVYGRA
jgi:NAD(P)-dependent dehydrogenase (short-subunit alcohol dehydrogenase family)